MVKPVNYALIMHGAVNHVALKLEGAAPAALSFSELLKGYSHPNPADLNRVRKHEKTEDSRAAEAWVIRRAVDMLDGLVVDGDMVSFADGKGFDDLTWEHGKPERPAPDIYAAFGDPFNPLSGIFSDNIREELRAPKDPAYDELHKSMKDWGWLEGMPAIADERGVILVGHRRMAVAKELGIEPVVKRVNLGEGDYADAQRLKLAIGSNIAGKPLSPNDRKRIAAYLKLEHGWSQEKIAEALNVTQKTVSKDLDDIIPGYNVKPGKDKLGRAKSTGRPKGNKKKDPEEKQVQRSVNTLPGEWEQFKEKAKAEGYSPAAKLGELLRQDVAAVLPVEHACTCPHCGNRHTRLE